ncbi:META domain-containing protein [Actinoplanes sp. L3-i22]|uniref:META domain-containing protein n=1 Tax=Actinoplanes sp. L3-i22 TaxID=2836373 RepID=UPI001C794E00|nr:META domain-containing protein [Actinoplanes sp. L3-i22]BCY08173.1 hypothetical protein L3i22_032610 [Actinoplanes sp. L3-i22]
MKSLIAVALSAAILAGCAGQAPAAAPGASDRAAAPGVSEPAAATVALDPVALVGLWQLSADGAPKNVVLRIGGPGDLELFQPCAVLTGDWRADETGLFAGRLDSRSGPPLCDGPDLGATVARAAGYRIDGAERVLVDDRGATVARLLPGAVPVTRPDLAADVTGVPRVTDEIRQRLRAAAPLPAGLTPVTAPVLLGRWLPVDRPARASRAYVEFLADGRWQGSDGCNGAGGGWAAGPGGSLVATAGASTEVGCDNVPVNRALATTRRAGLDGTTLVLLDVTGTELLRLTRQITPRR